MESGRRNFIMGYDPLGWGGGTVMESGRRNFIMGYDSFGWGGDTHGIWKKKLYHGIRPFRVGGEHTWNLEEDMLSWDTTL